jgi:MFS family permease
VIRRYFRDSPLAGTGFFRLWAGESISGAGYQVTEFALPVIAILSLGASPWEMGLIGAAGSAANLLLGLPAGHIADTCDRVRVMHLANAGRFALLLLAPILYTFHQLDVAVLLVVTFLVGGFSLLFDSAMSAYLPGLVDADQLTSANAWMQGSSSIGAVAGPGLAGTIVQVVGAPATLLIDAATYVASSLSLHAIGRTVRPSRSEEPEDTSIRSSVAGVTLLRKDRVQGPLALAAAHFNFFTAMFFALYAFYVLRTLHLSPIVFGGVAMAGGAAGVLAASVSNRVTARLGNGVVLFGAYGLPGIAGLLVPLAHGSNKALSAVLVATSLALWAALVVVNLVTSEAIKQALVPNHLLGRVTAAVRLISWGVEPFGALAGGALASSSLGLRSTMTLACIGVATSVIWLMVPGPRRLAALVTASPPSEGAVEPQPVELVPETAQEYR